VSTVGSEMSLLDWLSVGLLIEMLVVWINWKIHEDE
jgi:hypothetical protein